MRISQFTDYSLRVLLYIGMKEGMATVNEIAEAFNVSQNHLVKVVHHLTRTGYLNSYKGKGGGLKLAKSPTEIRIGDFVHEQEPMSLLECFEPDTNTCPIQGVCGLEKALYEARSAFIESLNRQTLADFLVESREKSERMRRLGLA